ncbi:hypothetical protein PR202_gn00714 [Eleusine coracana subsp. coracana]|uniref:Ribosomal protein L22 n=1 Tax=Eleusine coracana subsp. coracana TaxID=191504 RepID=A0AAV5G2P8_ELECO|nr:hypothetical protein PR202_gn00714 [Eleusine coracana subsp. coracana]
MTSFKLVKYIPRIKKKKNGLRKLARKVPTDRLLKFERVFKAQKRIHMSVFKAQRVLDEIRWRYYEETVYDTEPHALSSILSHLKVGLFGSSKCCSL